MDLTSVRLEFSAANPIRPPAAISDCPATPISPRR